MTETTKMPAVGELPAWNTEPMSDLEMEFLRTIVRSLTMGGHVNTAEIISHAENEIITLRSKVSALRQDRREAWERNARLRSVMIANHIELPEDTVVPT